MLPDRKEIRSPHPIESGLNNNQLFMQEDEMAFWLHPDLYSDIIDPAPPRASPTQVVRIPPPSAATLACRCGGIRGGEGVDNGGRVRDAVCVGFGICGFACRPECIRSPRRKCKKIFVV